MKLEKTDADYKTEQKLLLIHAISIAATSQKLKQALPVIWEAIQVDMDVRVMRDRFGDTEGFEVMLGGDCELETMIRALKFITKVLEDSVEEVYD